MKKFYVVAVLKKELALSAPPFFTEVPLSLELPEEGIVGFMPVFTNKKRAERFRKNFKKDAQILIFGLPAEG